MLIPATDNMSQPVRVKCARQQATISRHKQGAWGIALQHKIGHDGLNCTERMNIHNHQLESAKIPLKHKLIDPL